ncbi:hypothetical protein CEXT_392481 [Caerostris extrusa]|uniref:Uncharacterized protein n=1 Tax=Caerostris extrusa TaxID=172846 RepID=A0AAV4UIT9_CAEEX|nr:hypothetical protein CEXT_392481 [Caerostris extrusa]
MSCSAPNRSDEQVQLQACALQEKLFKFNRTHRGLQLNSEVFEVVYKTRQIPDKKNAVSMAWIGDLRMKGMNDKNEIPSPDLQECMERGKILPSHRVVVLHYDLSLDNPFDDEGEGIQTHAGTKKSKHHEYDGPQRVQ